MVCMRLATLCSVKAGFGEESAEASAGTALKDAASRLDLFEWPRLIAISPKTAPASVLTLAQQGEHDGLSPKDASDHVRDD